jgi:hypothetical protein
VRKRWSWKIEPTMAKKGKEKRSETERQQTTDRNGHYSLQWSRSIWKPSDGKRRCKKSVSIIVDNKNQSKDFP